MSALSREIGENPIGRAHLKRRLTAVLFADVVGYSRLMNADEEGTHLRLADCIETLFEPTVALHEGRLVRSKGDGFLVEFDSAVNAVNCAVDIQRALAERDDVSRSDRKLELRIGINSGDVIVHENDIYGNSVNIAARLEALAEPGGISVTGAVREQLLGHPDLSFEDRGNRWVKNIDRPIRVYRVISEPAAAPGSASKVWRMSRRSTRILALGAAGIATTIGFTELPKWHQSPFLSARASIMVLPFRNLNDSTQEYFADAVTEDLTTDLSRLADTMVIAPATAFTYKGQAVDPRQIGQEFGIRYILEGSIEKMGSRVHVNAHLVDTGSASDLWADRFESELNDPFQLQEAVTGRIASSLHLQLVRVESHRTEQTTDPDAYDLRLRAMASLINKLTPENTLTARHFLEKSLALDPHSANAWSQLAYVLMTDYMRTWNHAGEEVLKQAEEAVQKAYEINRSLALAHVAEGKIREVKGDLSGELDALNAALELDPNLPIAYAHKANTLLYLGKPQDAPDLLAKARMLDPRDPDRGAFLWIEGRAYFTMAAMQGTTPVPKTALEDYDKAIISLRQAVQENPQLWFPRVHLISAYALIGRLEEKNAVAAVDDYRTRFGEKWPLDHLKKYYSQAKYLGASSEFKKTIGVLIKGLEIAKEKGNFP
jgi:adenylate cyclase